MTEAQTQTNEVPAEEVIEVHQTADEAAVKDSFGKNLTLTGMQTRQTDTGDITFFNTDYVSPRVLDIIQWYCNTQVSGFNGLYSVIFRMDGLPKVDVPSDTPTSWMFFPDTLTAVCNIRGCIDVALFEVMSGDVKEAACINTWAVIWRAIVQNFFHEAHHAQTFLNDRELLDSKGQKGSKARDDEEQAAIVYAQTMMIEAAKALNIEPEFTPEVADIIQDRIADEMEAIDDESPSHHKLWASNMKYMLKHGFIVHIKTDEGYEDKSYSTLKEFMHSQSGDAENDPAWLIQHPDTTCVGTTTNTINPIADSPAPVTQTGGFMSPPNNNNGYVIEDDDYNDDDIDYGQAQSPTNTIHANNAYQTPNANGMQGAANVANGYAGPNTTPQNPVAGPPAQFNQPAVVGGQSAQPLNWDTGYHQAIVKGLYQKLANNIFGKCQFIVGQTANTPFFMNVPGIEAPLPLSPEEAQLVIAQTITQNGKFMKDQPVQNNAIGGCTIGKAKLMPGYELVLNNGQGGQIRRKFIPQNPWKTSKTAEWARNGHQIVWIIDPDAADKSLSMRVMGGIVESNRSGQWAAV